MIWSIFFICVIENFLNYFLLYEIHHEILLPKFNRFVFAQYCEFLLSVVEQRLLCIFQFDVEGRLHFFEEY